MKIKTIRLISLILLVIWTGVIFGFSAQNSEDSSEVSHGIVDRVAEAVYPNYKNLNESEKQEVLERIDMPVRKLAHFLEFFVLGLIAFVFFATFNGFSLKLKFIIPFVYGLIYAVIDELHQLLVAGRACRVLDVCIDLAGVLLAVISGFLVFKKMRSGKIG